MRIPAILLATGFACVFAASGALAVDMPINGVFGMTPQDCQAAKDENEGGYVAFEKMSTGEGGQGGCDFTAVQKTGPDRYALTGTCKALEGPKKRKRITLVVKNATDIVYDGTDYRRCPGQ